MRHTRYIWSSFILLLSTIIWLEACQKASKSPKRTSRAPSSEDLCQAGSQADINSAVELATEEESYGLVNACDLSVKKINVENKFYGGSKYKSPVFSFDASDETAYLNCQVRSLANDEDCTETFKANALSERKLKCSGDLQIKCQACADLSKDSCSCSKKWTSVVFKKADDQYVNDGNQTTEDAPAGLQLTENNSLLVPMKITGNGSNAKIEEIEELISKVDKNIIGNRQSSIQDFINAQAIIDDYFTKIAATGQNEAKNYIKKVDDLKCKDPLILGLQKAAKTFVDNEASVLGQRLRSELETVIAEVSAENQSQGSGLYLASGDSCKDLPSEEEDDSEEYASNNEDSSSSRPSVDDLLGTSNNNPPPSSSPPPTNNEDDEDESGEGEEPSVVSPPTEGGTDLGTEGTEGDGAPQEEEQGGSDAGKWVGGIMVALGSVALLYGAFGLYRSFKGKPAGFKNFVSSPKSLWNFYQQKQHGTKAQLKTSIEGFDNIAKVKTAMVDFDTPEMKAVDEKLRATKVTDIDDAIKKAGDADTVKLKVGSPAADVDFKTSELKAYSSARTTLESNPEFKSKFDGMEAGKFDQSKFKTEIDFDTKYKAAVDGVKNNGYYKAKKGNLNISGLDPEVQKRFLADPEFDGAKFRPQGIDPETGKPFKGADGGGMGKFKAVGIMVGGIVAMTIGAIVLNKTLNSDKGEDDPNPPKEEEEISLALTASENTKVACIQAADEFQSVMGVLGKYIMRLNDLAGRVEAAKIMWGASAQNSN